MNSNLYGRPGEVAEEFTKSARDDRADKLRPARSASLTHAAGSDADSLEKEVMRTAWLMFCF
jgi:hypothetical protein